MDRRERAALGLILLAAAALRLPGLSEVPPGLIPDEALLAYEARSILATGRDQYGEWLPLFPRSTERWGCLYMYLALPSVALLDLTPLAARLPSALAGILTVFLTYRLVRRSHGALAALAAAALLAASPWHVLISRTGYDWSLVPPLAILFLLAFLRFLRGGSSLWAGAALALCFYSYAPLRALAPLLLLGLLALHGRDLRGRGRGLFPGAAVALAAALPVLLSLGVGAAQRLETVTERRAPLSTQVREAGQRYLSSFSPRFYMARFGEGDLHRLRSTGLLYGFELPLAVLGLLLAALDRRPGSRLFVYWTLVGPLVVAAHRDCPDPVLLVTLLPMPQVLGGIAVAWLAEVSRRALGSPRRKALLAVAALWPAREVAVMASDLYRQYAVYAAPAWSHGVGETVREAEALRAAHTDVLVDGRQKLIFSLILFHARLPPELRQRETQALGGRAYRTRVGDYRVGDLTELLATPGRHLVWTTRSEGRRLFPGLQPLRLVRWPDGRPNHALFTVESPGPWVPRAR